MRNNTIKKKGKQMTRESHVAQETHENKTIMCHIIIINKTQASSSRWTLTRTVQKRLSFLLTRCCLYGICMYWGKPWMNYCTFLLFSSFISIFKDCQHHESISLYNVHNYRALVQHWKVERRHYSFLCLFLWLFFGFGYSFIVKPQSRSTYDM